LSAQTKVHTPQFAAAVLSLRLKKYPRAGALVWDFLFFRPRRQWGKMNRQFLLIMVVLVLCISIAAAVKTLTVYETEPVSLRPQATDADKDSITYSYSPPLDSDGKWQTGYGDQGEYIITINASDGEAVTTKDVLLVVKKKNIPPVIDSAKPGTINLEVEETGKLTFGIKASDINKDSLTYSWKIDDKEAAWGQSFEYSPYYGDAGTHKIKAVISDGDVTIDKAWQVSVKKVDRESAIFSSFKDIEAEEGKVLQLDLPDFKKYNLDYELSDPLGQDNYWQIGYDEAGIYNIALTIKDGKYISTKKIKVVVKNIDRPLSFKPIANSWITEGDKITIALEADDPDGEKIKYSAQNLPEGAALKDNVFEWQTSPATVSKDSLVKKALDNLHLLYTPYKITFTASADSEEKQSATIFIKNINQPPVLETIEPIIVDEGEEINIEPKAADPDGDKLSYSYRGWFDVNRYKTTFDDAGNYKVSIIASDGFLTDEKTVDITVNDINRPPQFSPMQAVEISEAQEIKIPLLIFDPEEDPIEFIKDSLPKNAAIKEGKLIYTPDYDTVKEGSTLLTINLKATDGTNNITQPIDITVHNKNRPPKITGASKVTAAKKG